MTYPITIQFDVQWGEMDALGHVNNARYFTWFESVRIAAFQRVGLAMGPEDTVSPILATTTANYLKPVTYPDALTVGARFSKVGNTSFVMEYAVWRRGQPNAPVATGSGVVVVLDVATGQKVRVPDDIREQIAALQPA